ncbi:MAG: hypothetical protein IIX12_07035, partial [Alistipes sp.]|nr:hypothetical protein [Alistipes sp.]
ADPNGARNGAQQVGDYKQCKDNVISKYHTSSPLVMVQIYEKMRNREQKDKKSHPRLLIYKKTREIPGKIVSL